MITDIKKLQMMVRFIIENPHRYEWSVQGLGMLRLYIGKEARLHIWDSELEYPNVSKLHNHSWESLHSTIICGQLKNTRFLESPHLGKLYNKRRLVCGINCEFVEESKIIKLVEYPTEIYFPGDSYSQNGAEIHLTETPVDGTITFMIRKYDGPTGNADIYWPVGTEWGTAEPREATGEEIERTTQKSLKLL